MVQAIARWWAGRKWCLPFCHDFRPAAPPTGTRPNTMRLHRCTRCSAEGEWEEAQRDGP